MKPKIKWLKRFVAAPGPHLVLCTTQEQFDLALKDLKLNIQEKFVGDGAPASTHTFKNEEYGIACVVCIRDNLEKKPSEIAGILVHEGVHVWQEYAEYIGEDSPGKEQEAYAIQAIVEELIQSYSDQLL